VFQKLADAIMLFYDEAEADRMFREAGFEEFRHVTMGPDYNPEIAITTIAQVPGDTDDGDPATETETDPVDASADD
jgi:hypothetical protein